MKKRWWTTKQSAKTRAKRWVAKTTHIPTTRAGRQRKVGRLVERGAGCSTLVLFSGTLVALFFVCTRAWADDKPVELKADELAVLADRKSPDREKLAQRYEGKVVKITGKPLYNPSRAPGRPYFYLGLPEVKFDEQTMAIKIEWSKDPSTTAAQSKAQRDGLALTGGTKLNEAFAKLPAIAMYGRLTKEGLADAATDPKVGGKPYEKKEKEPAKLKD